MQKNTKPSLLLLNKNSIYCLRYWRNILKLLYNLQYQIIPYNQDKSKTFCSTRLSLKAFQKNFLCDFVEENSFEKNARTTFLIW